MTMLRFELRHSTRAGVYQHLALFGPHISSDTSPLAHWFLPYESCGLPELEHVLLLAEAGATTVLPSLVLDAGPALLSTATFPIQHSITQLRLLLYGQHLAGQFEVQRLQPGGTIWLLVPTAAAVAQTQRPLRAARYSQRISTP